MSTHIETGFLLKTNDFAKILSAVRGLRTRAAELARDLLKAHVIELAVKDLDQACMQQDGLRTVNFISSALDKLYQAQKEVRNTGYRDPDVDMSLTLTFFPFEDQTLGMAFAPNPRILAMVEGLPGWEDYHYQNQTDKPQEISEEDWEKRRRDWDVVLLDASGIPEREGFSIKVLPMIGLLSYQFAGDEPVVTDLNKRAHHIAVDNVVARAYRALDAKDKTIPKLTHLVFNATELPGYAEEKSRALQQLIPNPTLSMLKGITPETV